MRRSRSSLAAEADLERAAISDAPIEVVQYDPAWPASYEAERSRLQRILPDAEIHHIGSTAVPGLQAKPVIDIMALLCELDAPIESLTALAGYQFPVAFNATLTNRRFLCYPSASHRSHHLHLVDDPAELERHLRFRDRLRSEPGLASEYAALKRSLAARHRNDREAYTDAKGEFVQSALEHS